MARTKKAYEEYLNDEIQPDWESEKWIIGGKNRRKSYYDAYGSALRKYDPIAFDVGYNDWRRE